MASTTKLVGHERRTSVQQTSRIRQISVITLTHEHTNRTIIQIEEY